MQWLWQSLYFAAAMLWEMLWALVFGFTISAAMQVFVSKEKMAEWFGRAGWREIGLATALGAASSSCSYAASATANTAFKKGAAFIPSVAFMFASTNLVAELGLVLWMLMGWRFVLAEFVGAFVLIGVMWIIMAITLPQKLVDAARKRGSENGGGCHQHDHGEHAHKDDGMGTGIKVWSRIADAFFMDVSMLWKEILLGVVIAGFLMVLVPHDWWKALFDTQNPSPLRLIGNASIGPLIALASFVCSVGNIPLAALLWSSGIGFGGVIAFIYGDLLVLPLLSAYRKYYGTKLAAYLALVLYLSMVIASMVVDLLFTSIGLAPAPHQASAAMMHAGFLWNYTTWLNFVAIAFGAWLVFVHRKSGSASKSHCC